MNTQPENQANDMPKRVGPFTVERLLGQGGMGAVYLAHDVGLDRYAALKCLRSDRHDSPEAWDRFRREARLAASLSHANLVQIFGLYNQDGRDYLAMEYVDGNDLRTFIGTDPLPIETWRDIAKQVTQGLAALHRAGIVHRDLKAANVLRDHTGNCKVTDLGISRAYSQDDDTDSLTSTGALIGTARSMSPEQAAGKPADKRSDLFSLGVLLYEMATGKQPFAGENTLDELSRIVHYDPPPPNAVHPSFPSEETGLVMHLLQKDPDMRPRGVDDVRATLERLPSEPLDVDQETILPDNDQAATQADPTLKHSEPAGSLKRKPMIGAGFLVAIGFALALIVAIFWLIQSSSESAEPLMMRYIAVDEPSLTGESPFPFNASVVTRDLLIQSLLSAQGLIPVERSTWRRTRGSWPERAKAASANEILRADIACDAGMCQLTLERLDGLTGEVIDLQTASLPLFSKVFRDTVQASVGEIFEFEPGEFGLPSIEPDDYDRYLLLVGDVDKRARPWPELLAEASELRASAPDFPGVYTLEHRILRRLFRGKDGALYREQANQLIAKANRRFPGDSSFLTAAVQAALDAADFDQAHAHLVALKQSVPSGSSVLMLEARLAYAEGEQQQALALMRQAVAQRPSWNHLANLANMEGRLGLMDEAREHLNQALSLVPEHPSLLRLQAQWSLLYGHPRDAVAQYESLLSKSESPGSWNNLGLAKMLLEDFVGAAACFEKIAGEDDPALLLNRADAYFLAGEKARATALYERVVALTAEAGNDWQYWTIRAQAQAHLSQPVEAAQALQQGLKLAPEQAQTAYEAALVHAILGERASALTQARRALERGYNPRWFRFPWFENIRGELTASGELQPAW